ncbi:MAG: alpha/beta hydrolase [Verrucomicrobia bacterium]|nr:alpha/beta hydrolase [Verrucomicrobiota bacterium]
MRVQLIFVVASLCVQHSGGADFHVDWQELWVNGAPKALGKELKDIPAIGIRLAAAHENTGAAVIVCPGGGNPVLAIDHEGLQVCNWLNSFGVNAFLLRYRVMGDNYSLETAYLDGLRAVRYVRHRAQEYKVDEKRIGMLGFSAGGSLAWWVARGFDDGGRDALDPVERVSSRPDFAVLAYPAALLYERRGVKAVRQPVGPRSPPMFFFHTDADQSVPAEDILDMYLKLREARISTELHIFGGFGPHGVGLADGEPVLREWTGLAERWMRKGGFLTEKPRVAVSGSVTIDGQPLWGGWVTFSPVESQTEPTVAAIVRPFPKPDGKFTILPEYGPTIGRYRATVYEIAKAMDRIPSISGIRTYRSAGLGMPPLVFEITTGDNVLNLQIVTRAERP